MCGFVRQCVSATVQRDAGQNCCQIEGRYPFRECLCEFTTSPYKNSGVATRISSTPTKRARATRDLPPAPPHLAEPERTLWRKIVAEYSFDSSASLPLL